MDHLSIGLELEANVIHAQTGQAVIDFNNSPQFYELDRYLAQKNIHALHTEFDAATVEFVTQPHGKIPQVFDELYRILFHASEFLKERDYRLLLLGLHPGREANFMQMTHKQRCYDSLPLMDGQYGSLFYCSLQINLGLPTRWKDYLFPLCHALQAHMWPCSVITQASSVFANRSSQYQCYRTHLNEEISHDRTGPLPLEIKTWEAFQRYCAQLSGKSRVQRLNNVWFDIFPKLQDEQNPEAGYRIEIRLADSSDLNKLYHYTSAIALTYLSFLEKISQNEILPQEQLPWFILNREQILRKGREAELIFDGKKFSNLEDYLKHYWQPLVSSWFLPLAILPETLIPKLLSQTRSEMMVSGIEKSTGDQLALKFAEIDAQALRSEIGV